MLTALRGMSLPQRLSFPQYLPKRLGLAWVKVKNPNYWRRDAELEAMQRARPASSRSTRVRVSVKGR